MPVNVARDILGPEDIEVADLYARSHDDALKLAAATMDKYAGHCLWRGVWWGTAPGPGPKKFPSSGVIPGEGRCAPEGVLVQDIVHR